MRLSFLREYRIDRFWVDFALKGQRLVIEAEGRLYHYDRDKEDAKDEVLRRNGWECLHLDGPTIMNDVPLAKRLISEALWKARELPQRSLAISGGFSRTSPIPPVVPLAQPVQAPVGLVVGTPVAPSPSVHAPTSGNKPGIKLVRTDLGQEASN